MRTSLVTAIAITTLTLGCGGGGGDTPDSGDPGDGGGNPVVVLATSMGDLVVELFPAEMPLTTANFLSYVDSSFYDGTLVHRVVDDWVIQGGGYTSGLVEKSPGAPIALETSAAVSHVHGAISMARLPSDPDSATSQWFICDWPESGTAPQPGDLDGQFAAFGVLIEGFDVLAAITQVTTTDQPPLYDIPETEILVTSASRR